MNILNIEEQEKKAVFMVDLIHVWLSWDNFLFFENKNFYKKLRRSSFR